MHFDAGSHPGGAGLPACLGSGNLGPMPIPKRETTSAPDQAVFLSDVHLGSASDRGPAREERLLAFLRGRAATAQRLFILGDLFDFWFEYRHAIPRRHLRVVLALRELVAGGVPVEYFGGNHDFWVGSFLAEEVGATVHDEPRRVDWAGRRMVLMHGDGLAR